MGRINVTFTIFGEPCLRLRSPPSGNTRRFTRMHTPTSSWLLVFSPSSDTYPFLFLLPSPPSHLVTSIYSMALGTVTGTFPVASRYRYIPNTLGRKRFCWLPFFPACVCTHLITLWFQFVICFALLALSIRFVRFLICIRLVHAVASSLR